MIEVNNLEQLLAPFIGSEKRVVSSIVSPLTAPGENYTNVVLKVDVNLQDEETGLKETLHLVGKFIHSGDVAEMYKHFGKLYYKTELVWYTEILPTLQNFAKESGCLRNFDIFPKLIAYRANLHGENDEPDENSVLFMENLTINGFKNIDRHVSFDYEGAKMILNDLATFHAIPIAMKLNKPTDFEEKIKKHLVKEESSPAEPKEEENEEDEPKQSSPDHGAIWIEALAEYANCQLYLPKLKKLFEEFNRNKKSPWGEKVKNEPFVTITHTDLWVNNTMQVLNGDRIVSNKFVDFQTYSYDSPVHDLLFFIWSSVQTQVIKKHFNDLLIYYHKNLMEAILEFGCDVSPFSYDKFEEELKVAADVQLLHTICLSKAIFCEKGEYAFDISGDAAKCEPKVEDIKEIVRCRIALVLQICGEKGWISS